MPLFVDGVEIKAVFIDGVQVSSVFADGVEVFSPGSEHLIGVANLVGGLANNFGAGVDYPAAGNSFGTITPGIESIGGRVIRGATMSSSNFAPTDITFYLTIEGDVSTSDEYGVLSIEGLERELSFDDASPVYSPEPDFTIIGFPLPEFDAIPPEWAVGQTPTILIGAEIPPPVGVTHNLSQGIVGTLVGYNNGLVGAAYGSIDDPNFNGIEIAYIRFIETGVNPWSFSLALVGEAIPQDFFYQIAYQGINNNEPLLALEAEGFVIGGGVTEWRWSLGETPPRWSGNPLNNCWGIMDSDAALKFGSVVIIDVNTVGYSAFNMASNGNTLVVVYNSGSPQRNGQIKTSTDGGNTWTVTLTQTIGPFFDICFGNGLFVATGGNTDGGSGANAVIYTSPDGGTWTPRTVPNPSLVRISGVIWSEVGQVFLAACKRANSGFILSSPDGITWTERTQNGGIGSTEWVSITENVADGLIWTLGSYLTGTLVMSSTDGINWSGAGTSVPNAGSIYFDEANRVYWYMLTQQRVVKAPAAASGNPGNSEDVTPLGWGGNGQAYARPVALSDGDNMLMPGFGYVTSGLSVKSDRVNQFTVQDNAFINGVHESSNGRIWAVVSDSIRELIKQ